MNQYNKNITFPFSISLGAEGGPEFSTLIAETTSGHEIRNANWDHPRLRFTLDHTFKSNQDIEKLIEFFRIVKGRANAFRFRDFSDFTSLNQRMKYLGNHQYQLVKHYGDQIRIVNRPVSNSVHIRGISHDQFTVDADSGIVTIAEDLPEGEYFASFEFDVLVRFENDYLPIKFIDHNYTILENINLVEVK